MAVYMQRLEHLEQSYQAKITHAKVLAEVQPVLAKAFAEWESKGNKFDMRALNTLTDTLNARLLNGSATPYKGTRWDNSTYYQLTIYDKRLEQGHYARINNEYEYEQNPAEAFRVRIKKFAPEPLAIMDGKRKLRELPKRYARAQKLLERLNEYRDLLGA